MWDKRKTIHIPSRRRRENTRRQRIMCGNSPCRILRMTLKEIFLNSKMRGPELVLTRVCNDFRDVHAPRRGLLAHNYTIETENRNLRLYKDNQNRHDRPQDIFEQKKRPSEQERIPPVVSARIVKEQLGSERIPSKLDSTRNLHRGQKSVTEHTLASDWICFQTEQKHGK